MRVRFSIALVGVGVSLLFACNVDDRQVGVVDTGAASTSGDAIRMQCLPSGGGGSSASAGEQVNCPALRETEHCEGKASRCNGMLPEVCSGGAWLPGAPCSLVCVDGRCGECTTGERCRDGAVETCGSGFWKYSEKCPEACEAGRCVSACTEGRTQCNGDILQRCEQGEYRDAESCSVSCLSTEQGDQCGGECRRLSTRCVPDERGEPSNETQACTEQSIWSPTTADCGDAFCLAGLCTPCAPGAGRCGSGGPERCNAGGEWAAEPPCGAALPVCLEGICGPCAPGESRCAEDALEVCADDGRSWSIAKRCTGDTPTCLDRIPDCGRCAPGERQCNGDTVQTCNAAGNYQDDHACFGDAPDCVAGACRACDPAGDTRCESATDLQGCDIEGNWGAVTSCTGDAPICREDLGRCGCVEEDRRCANDATPERCLGGNWVRQTPCVDSTPVCLPSSGSCVACTPGAETCLNGIVQRCDSAGSFQSTAECASEQRNCGSCDIGSHCGVAADCRGGVCLDGICAVCRPDDHQCVGTTPRTCAPEGNWVNAAPCTGDFALCVPETATCTCREGASLCAGANVERRCTGGQVVQSACAVGSSCLGDRCRVQEWTKQFGSTGSDSASSVRADANDNVFVAGRTEGTLPGQAGSGSDAAFLRKYDAKGTELWTRQFSGTSSTLATFATSLSVDGSGNVFVAGGTDGEAFVKKYDTNGNELWTQQLGLAATSVDSVAVDAGGGVLVAGSTAGAFPGQVYSGGLFDAFVRKYDGTGTELWTRQFGTEGNDIARSVSVDGSNVLVAGETGSAIGPQYAEAFVKKYDNTGTELWARQFGTAFTSGARSVSVDGGNVLVVGFADSGAFVTKYDRDGTELWTRQFGSTGIESTNATSVTVGGGNVFVAGSTNGTLPGQVSSGSFDGFVRKYDSNGVELWTRQFGSMDIDSADSVSLDGSGSILVAGSTFGFLPGQDSLGPFDAFVLKLVE